MPVQTDFLDELVRQQLDAVATLLIESTRVSVEIAQALDRLHGLMDDRTAVRMEAESPAG